ncbi:abortive infection family protein [Streptomyces rubiginosohelvolus]|uniref:abortive infection family protein n=1 Tax=Streptomyces rubiginosohelvolus TaxID=67362 RepID=UPI00364A7A30
MSTPTDLSASVTTKLRRFLKQGQERLEEIDAFMRRLGVDSLKTDELTEMDSMKAVFDEAKNRAIEKARKWVADLDEYAKGYLSENMRRRVTQHPNGLGGDDLPAHIDNARIAVHSRIQTVKQLIGEATPTPAGSERDAAGGWTHLRELGLVEDAVLDGYLNTMRTRRTVAQRRAAIGAAKELVEAAMKGAIHYADPAATGFEKDEMPQLWKRLRTLIQEDHAADRALGGKEIGVAKTLSGMNNLITGIAEMRNRVGSGHGTPTAPKGLQESHVLLVIDSAHTITRFVTSRLNELFA